jgi:hypothetical protein
LSFITNDEGRAELDHRLEAGIGLLAAHGDALELFEFAEEILMRKRQLSISASRAALSVADAGKCRRRCRIVPLAGQQDEVRLSTPTENVLSVALPDVRLDETR